MKHWAFLFFLTIGIGGCAPGLGTTLKIDSIPEQQREDFMVAGARGLNPLSVQVWPIMDARGDPAIGEIDGRSLRPGGDIGSTVQAALEEHFRSRGVALGIENSPIISGEVTKWYITIHPGFPLSEAESVASIQLEVLDNNNAIVYSAIYSGNTNIRDFFLTQEKTEETLGKAMGFALQEAMSDQKLIDKLLFLAGQG